MGFVPSASQTIGPFFNFALTTNTGLGVMADKSAVGEHIKLVVQVSDGDGTPASGDAMIELWQADAQGRYSFETQEGFRGFGRLETGIDGTCVFETIRPVRIGEQAPFINVIVFARGLLRHLYTRIYFEDDPTNAIDAVLMSVPVHRRSTLLAKRTANQSTVWNFDIRLQGEAETVFFDL